MEKLGITVNPGILGEYRPGVLEDWSKNGRTFRESLARG
jgi:hypothetical protein